MALKHDENYWIDTIRQCRSSGLSDRIWCEQNNVPLSTFYYHVRRLRNKACVIPVRTVSGPEPEQEVVPLEIGTGFTDGTSDCPVPVHGRAFPAICLTLQGIRVDISNHADKEVIHNTLDALLQLC